jgi:hypothetical protein
MFGEYVRLKRIQAHLAEGRLDSSLRWTNAVAAV